MPRKFVYIQNPDDEVIFNPETIQSVSKIETKVYISFLFDDEPLILEGEPAKAYWDELYESSYKASSEGAFRSRTFVYVQTPDCEVIFNPDVVQFIHKKETGLYIKFLANYDALYLQGEIPQAYWNGLYESSNKNYPKPEESPDPDWVM
jgi:hypothetical protein